MLLSVIIPVYNVSATLRECVDSVISQSVDCEIILVDDGSPDASGRIADEYAGLYDFVKVIHRKNGGLSAARNSGLEICRGEVVTFVDSDDYLLPDTYSRLLAILDEASDIDILEYSVVQEGEGPAGRDRDVVLPDATYTDGRDAWTRGRMFSHAFACNKLFRRRVLFEDGNRIINRFPEGKVFEDVWFTSEVLSRNPRVGTCSIKGYVYRWNPEGISANADASHVTTLLENHLHALEALDIQFDGRKVSYNDAACYLALLNAQITCMRVTGGEPLLRRCHVPLRGVQGAKNKIKVLLFNILGFKLKDLSF